MRSRVTITVVENLEAGASVFSEENYALEDFNGMWISSRQSALNFRHRASDPGYKSDWHVAGDPTLIIVRQGTLRLWIRDGSYRDFGIGDQFIARDFLPKGVDFNPELHGHRAEVIGGGAFVAVHIKLAQVEL